MCPNKRPVAVIVIDDLSVPQQEAAVAVFMIGDLSVDYRIFNVRTFLCVRTHMYHKALKLKGHYLEQLYGEAIVRSAASQGKKKKLCISKLTCLNGPGIMNHIAFCILTSLITVLLMGSN